MIQGAKDASLAVIGAGSWGTTLANLLAEKGEQIDLWVHDPEQAERLVRERTNAVYLPGVPVHTTIRPTADLRQVVRGAKVFISVVPSHATRAVWRVLGPLLPEHALVVSATKGIEAESLLTMSGVLRDTIPAEKRARIAVLSGPSFAREVSQKTPAAVVAAATERAVAEAVQTLCNTPEFRVYTNTDVLGVELGGALKNVMAIAAGVCDGLQFGYNARAALITRGLAEITQLGLAMGAKAQTFAGLSGMGDLVLTCTGDLSRNHAVGVQLGQDKKLQEILQDMRMVAEGVATTGSAVALGQMHRVEMPIAEHIHALLHGHISPQDAVTALMTRSLKQEDD